MEDNSTYGLIAIFDLVILCVRYKRQIALVTAVGVLCGLLIAALSKPSFTAVATILPPSQPAPSLLAQVSNLAGSGGMTPSATALGMKSSTDLYVSLLRSRSVEDAVIEHFALKQEFAVDRDSDARRILESHVLVDGSGKDGLIRLSLKDHDAARARDLVNGWIDQYQQFMQHLAIGEAAQRRLFFERQLQREKNELASAEEALKVMQQSSGAIQLDSQTRLMIESTANLRAQISSKEIQVQSMASYAGPGNVDLIAARNELEALRLQLRGMPGGQGSEKASSAESRGAIPQVSLDYVRGERDVKYHEALFQILANQYEAARLDESRESAVFQSIDRAVKPDKASSPGAFLVIGACTLAGAFTGVLFTLSREAAITIRRTAVFRERMARMRALHAGSPSTEASGLQRRSQTGGGL